VDVGLEHTLVIGILKARIQSIRKLGLQRKPRLDISKLKAPAQQKEFSLLLRNSLQVLAEDTSLENKLGRDKSMFTTTAEEDLGFKKRGWI